MVRPGMTWRGAVEGPRSRGDAQGKYSDEEDLEDIFKIWQQNTANRRMGDAEAQADAEATTVASSHEEASAPSTKKLPTMSGRAVATPQLPGARVPTGVLWRFC